MYAQSLGLLCATDGIRTRTISCVVDQLSAKLAADGYSILNLLADLTQADSFRLRVRGTP